MSGTQMVASHVWTEMLGGRARFRHEAGHVLAVEAHEFTDDRGDEHISFSWASNSGSAACTRRAPTMMIEFRAGRDA